MNQNNLPGRSFRQRIALGINALMLALLCSTGTASAQDETVFFFNDALGSPVAAVNEQGSLCYEEFFTPYGDKTINRGDNAGCGLIDNELGFTGHTGDVDSGLVYMQQRYYDPSIGRFLSVDPMDANPNDPRTYNRYAYANNNPYRYVDPDGRWAEDIFIGVPSLGIGLYSLGSNILKGNWGWAVVDAVGVVADAVAIATPGVPGGAGITVKAARAGDTLIAGSVPNTAGSIRNVNPTGGTKNCVNCAVATDATLAGRRASALPGSPTSISVLEKTFGGTFKAVSGQSEISSILAGAGNGSRGIVFGARGDGVGHVFNAVNQKGTVRFLDGQTGKSASFDGFSGFQFLRTN